MALSPLLEKCPEVFKCPMFDAFKEDVAISLKWRETDVPANLPSNLMVALQAWNLVQANGVTDTRLALAAIYKRLDDFEECFTNQHEQNNWVNDGLDMIKKMHALIWGALEKLPPVGFQPYFPGIQPFFGHGMPQPIISPPFQYQQHQQRQQSTMHPGPQRPPSSKSGNHRPQAIRPVSSATPAPPLHVSRRSRPLGVLPASFRRNREIAAAQGPTVSGDLVASTNVQVQAALPAKDWFVRNDYPTNTRDVYEELER
ncbi:hypothetical protein BG006_004274, partial [Podila minutissima]